MPRAGAGWRRHPCRCGRIRADPCACARAARRRHSIRSGYGWSDGEDQARGAREVVGEGGRRRGSGGGERGAALMTCEDRRRTNVRSRRPAPARRSSQRLPPRVRCSGSPKGGRAEAEAEGEAETGQRRVLAGARANVPHRANHHLHRHRARCASDEPRARASQDLTSASASASVSASAVRLPPFGDPAARGRQGKRCELRRAGAGRTSSSPMRRLSSQVISAVPRSPPPPPPSPS